MPPMARMFCEPSYTPGSRHTSQPWTIRTFRMRLRSLPTMRAGQELRHNVPVMHVAAFLACYPYLSMGQDHERLESLTAPRGANRTKETIVMTTTMRRLNDKAQKMSVTRQIFMARAAILAVERSKP